ncbi:MAG TPA: ABC transporter permease [Candidatus Tetragenococcus pullicola]|nr:ABC transporter permease [Candidatus Tetragenococcus pullicola]
MPIVIASASFYGLIAGGQFIVGAPILGDRLNDLVISYVLWMLILNAVGDSGFGIAEEAETGTLEQLYLSPMQPTTLFLIRTSVNMLFSLVFVLVVLTLLIFLMKIPFAFDIALLLPILLALLVAMGIGLLVASLAILFKRINQLLNIIQFVFYS